MVYAIRTKRKEGLLKRASCKIFYRVLRWLASVEIPVDAGDFCVTDRAVIDVLKAMPERTRFLCGGFAVGRGFVKWVWPTSVPCVMPAHRNTRSQNCFD